jgi:alpha-methylacyl-CoA racemase
VSASSSGRAGADPGPSHGAGLLAGVRILDLSVWRPGPYATQLLAELGAEVIKVEPPGGDPMRTYPGLFAALHADQRSLVLDLKSEAGRRRALDLAADADVVMEGFRPGVADRLGVGYDQVRAVNPAVVYCSVSGLGQDGPLAAVAGHDLNYGAWSGLLAPDGGEPRVPAVPVADLAGGMAAAFGVCAALVRGQRTGEGERIDVAMASVLATWTGAVGAAAAGRHESTPGPRGVPGYGTFATADGGHVALGVVNEDHFWGPLCAQLGLDDVAGLGFADRCARLGELQGRLGDVIARRDRDELVAALLAAGVPVAPVLDRREMVALDHFRAVGAVIAADGPDGDAASGFPVRFARHPARRLRPPPGLDEHPDAAWEPR